MHAGRGTFISAAALLVAVAAGCSNGSDGVGTPAGGSGHGGEPGSGGAGGGGAPSGGALGGGGAPPGGGGSSVGGGGCGASTSSDAGVDAATTDDGGGNALTGAWFGSGHCLVLCANGRLFIADKLCTETTVGDFDTYIQYTAAGSALTLTSSPSCWYNESCANHSVTVAVNGNLATAKWCGFTLHMTRVGASSPLCDDSCRTAC